MVERAQLSFRFLLQFSCFKTSACVIHFHCLRFICYSLLFSQIQGWSALLFSEVSSDCPVTTSTLTDDHITNLSPVCILMWLLSVDDCLLVIKRNLISEIDGYLTICSTHLNCFLQTTHSNGFSPSFFRYHRTNSKFFNYYKITLNLVVQMQAVLPVWILTWLLNVLSCRNCLPQKVQPENEVNFCMTHENYKLIRKENWNVRRREFHLLYGFSPVCIFMWLVRVELCLNSRLQTWHSVFN